MEYSMWGGTGWREPKSKGDGKYTQVGEEGAGSGIPKVVGTGGKWENISQY